MARWSARPNQPQTRVRIVSALIIALPALAAVYFGTPYLQLFILLCGGIVAWEWARLCGGGVLDWTGWLLIVAVLGALLSGAYGYYGTAIWAAGAAAIASGLSRLIRRSGAAGWHALGVLYVSLAGLSVMWLRQFGEGGPAVLFWLFAVVWLTDTGAYVAGRGLGGPKLAPAISPNKTWAGFFGGLVAGALVGLAAGALWPGREPASMAAFSVGLALAAQAGDLFESSLKRRFGVKDSSQLIPGHGGLLDRIDSLLAASLVVSLAYYWIGAA